MTDAVLNGRFDGQPAGLTMEMERRRLRQSAHGPLLGRLYRRRWVQGRDRPALSPIGSSRARD